MTASIFRGKAPVFTYQRRNYLRQYDEEAIGMTDTQRVDLLQCKKALENLVSSTAKFSNPPKPTDPDQLLLQALAELEAFRLGKGPEENTDVDIMFIDPGRIETSVYIFDLAKGKIKINQRYPGPAHAVVGAIVGILEKYKPKKVIINEAGFGKSYSETMKARISQFYQEKK
jgi:hypothetical protein